MTTIIKRCALATIALAVSFSAYANEPLVKEDDIPGDFSANLALTSEYFFRGMSQSDDNAALQGGFDYSLELDKRASLYLGVWGSNVNFTDANVEIDIYGGLSGEVSGLGWDVGGIYYYYPGAHESNNYEFGEASVALSYDFGPVSTALSLNYSPDYFGSSGDAEYLKLGVDVPLGKYVTASGHVAKQWIDDNATFGTPDYVDYSIGATVNVAGFDINLMWTDTDMSNAECPDLCGALLLTASRSF